MLLAAGANPDGGSSIEKPLHVAAGWGNEKAIRLLLEAGVNANTRSKYGLLPVDFAILSARNNDTQRGSIAKVMLVDKTGSGIKASLTFNL